MTRIVHSSRAQIRYTCRVICALCFLSSWTACQKDTTRSENHHRSTTKHRKAGQTTKAAVLRWLMRPLTQFRPALGPYKLSIKAHIERRVINQNRKVIDQRVSLQTDRRANFHIIKDTHEQHGFELIWIKPVIYSRLKFGRFLKRPPYVPQEPYRTASRQSGVLLTYLKLLREHIDVTPLKPSHLLGRQVQRFRLRSQKAEQQPKKTSGNSSWRSHIKVVKVAGLAWIDDKTQLPLKVTLSGTFTYPLPKGKLPKSGIPKAFSANETGTIQFHITHEIVQLSGIEDIQQPAPELVVQRPHRYRPEIERQMVAGERRLVKDWFDVVTHGPNLRRN